MEGKLDQWTLLHRSGSLKSRRLLLYGAGKLEKVTPATIQRVSGAALRVLSDRGTKTAAFLLRNDFDLKSGARAVAEGAILGQMRGNLYSSDKESKKQIDKLIIVAESAGSPDATKEIEKGRVMGEAANLTERRAGRRDSRRRRDEATGHGRAAGGFARQR
jgi:leucyl aminopeptidase